jgi:hypothetical protein
MSRINNNSRSINIAAPITPCCKVCKDAGKPESEYSSHWVKDKEGKVICPYIKGLNCNYCMNYGNASQASGHTPKYCKFLKKNTENNEKKKIPLPTPPQSKHRPGNKFAVFDDSDSDSGEDCVLVVPQEVVDLYPVLSAKVKATSKSVSVKFNISYAEKLATLVVPTPTPKPLPSLMVPDDNVAQISEDDGEYSPNKKKWDMAAFMNRTKTLKSKSWADASDSDSD